jgi:dihydroorotate dehydrogenase electron transfer subunit
MLAAIKENKELFSGYYLLDVAAKGIGSRAAPGQFYMLKVGASTDPLLRRPFSLHRVISADAVRFLYRSVGKGTSILSRLSPGEVVDVLGPLGSGFKVGKGVRHALIIGGGIGMAPLMALADYINNDRKDVTAAVFIGGRSREYVLGVGEFRKLGLRTYVSTEDGSIPRKGLITDSLDEYIHKYKKYGTGGWAVYSCGPKPMLTSVAAIAKLHGLKAYVSLEANMACGIGACMGCVVSIVENGVPVYKKVCDDGPVFDADTVLW